MWSCWRRGYSAKTLSDSSPQDGSPYEAAEQQARCFHLSGNPSALATRPRATTLACYCARHCIDRQEGRGCLGCLATPMAWALMPGFLLVPYILIPFAPLTRKRVAASTSKRAVRSGEYAYCVRISDDGPRPGAYAYGPGRTLRIRAGKRTDLAHSLARTCTFSLRLIPACGLDRRGSCPWPNQGQLLVVSSA